METIQSQWERRMPTPKSIKDVSIAAEQKTSGKLLAQSLKWGKKQERRCRNSALMLLWEGNSPE